MGCSSVFFVFSSLCLLTYLYDINLLHISSSRIRGIIRSLGSRQVGSCSAIDKTLYQSKENRLGGGGGLGVTHLLRYLSTSLAPT